MHPTFRFPRPLVLLVGLLAVVGLVAGACSGDDEGGTTTTEATEGGEDSATDDMEDFPEPEPVSDEELDEMVGGVLAEVQGAEDACALVDALGNTGTFPVPSSPAQVEVAVDFIGAVAERMADLSTDPALAEQLRAAGAGYRAYAESVGFDPEQVDLSGMDPEFTAATEFQTAANTWFETTAADCVPDMADMSEMDLEDLPDGLEAPAGP